MVQIQVRISTVVSLVATGQGPVTAAAGNVIHGDNINHRPPPAHSLDIAGVS